MRSGIAGLHSQIVSASHDAPLPVGQHRANGQASVAESGSGFAQRFLQQDPIVVHSWLPEFISAQSEDLTDVWRLEPPIHYALSASERALRFSQERERQIVERYLYEILVGIAIHLIVDGGDSVSIGRRPVLERPVGRRRLPTQTDRLIDKVDFWRAPHLDREMVPGIFFG